MPHTFIPSPEILDSHRGRQFAGAAPAALNVPEDALPAAASVVVLGGGPAALTLAAQLWHHGVHGYLLLERGATLAGRFFGRVDSLRQTVLRSPYEHHPGAEGHSDCEMLDFARLHWAELTAVERNEIHMAQSGQRGVAPIDIFRAYCSHVAAAHGVQTRARRAEVISVTLEDGDQPDATCWRVDTDRGFVRAGAVGWAVGERRRAAPLGWDVSSPRARFWDEKDCLEEAEPVHAVIGAGLSAAHIVHDLARQGRHVHWLFCGKEHYQCADVNAAFFRPEGRAIFMQRSLAPQRHASQRAASIDHAGVSASAAGLGTRRHHNRAPGRRCHLRQR